MIIIIEIVIFIIFLALLNVVHTRYSKNGRLIDKVPGLPTIPIIGNVHQLFLDRLEFLPAIDKINLIFYPIHRFWIFNMTFINIYHPDDAEALLSNTKNIKKGIVYKYIKAWLKTGLLISTGFKWQHRRKILTTAFHFHVLQKYMDVLVEHGAKVAESLKNDKKENVVELISFFTTHTLSAICETAMGTPLHALDSKEVNRYRDAVIEMGEIGMHRFVRPWLLSDFLFINFHPLGWKMQKVLKVLHSFSEKIIKERMEFHKRTGGEFLNDFSFLGKNGYNDDDDDSLLYKSSKKRMAMLDLLLSAHQDGLIDYDGIKEEVDTFIFEGHDTSAMALCYIIQLLAEHKDAQEKARKEVNEIWKLNEAISMNMLNKLNFLDRCIKESLRLFPSVPFISRQLETDLQLKNYLIPAGANVNLFIYTTHRDPNFWPDPNKFEPDRFLPEKILERHPFSYIPFSGGSRNCIGQRFAMMELKIFCAYILKNFYMDTKLKHTDLQRLPDFVYRPVQTLEVTFTQI